MKSIPAVDDVYYGEVLCRHLHTAPLAALNTDIPGTPSVSFSDETETKAWHVPVLNTISEGEGPS